MKLEYRHLQLPLSSCLSRSSGGIISRTPIPHLTAPDLAHAKQRHHVDSASQCLRQHGILKVSLGFPDPDSRYLEQLVLSLHQHHGHRLPIPHSASRGWFWDVRPTGVDDATPFQTPEHQARSETMEAFPWHTDCSYEELPPRYFALHVLQHDRFGGGTLSLMSVPRLAQQLSPSARASLMRNEYSIRTPPEFVRDPEKSDIVGSILTAAGGEDHHHSGVMTTTMMMMRFRRDIVVPLTERASRALQEVDALLKNDRAQAESTLHLSSGDLSAGSVVLLDNRRWLHARNNIRDPKRHLRRVRWDAVPF